MLRVSVIINPNAGPARRRAPAEAVALAERVVRARGAEPRVFVAERPGSGRALAAREIREGADVVCAWGGDGTINDIASVVSELGGVLAIVPAGSGNGLARDLAVPLDPRAALGVAVSGRERTIDAADFNGRSFFNVAGLGLDALVAHEFARRAGANRGLAAYVTTGARCLFSYVSARYDITSDGVRRSGMAAAMVTVANSRQWGNRMQIAPAARLDDGVLQVVVVGETRPRAIAWNLWRLPAGSIDRMRGVVTVPARDVTIEADRDVPVHLDGEPAGFARTAVVRIRPGALRVKAPAPS